MSPPADKSKVYAQACRDAHFIVARVKNLPWSDCRRKTLLEMEQAATSLLENIKALREAEKL